MNIFTKKMCVLPAGATGRCVTPYFKYPSLIDILINFLKTEQQRSIRRETIRVLGLLGAMDPYKHKMNKGLIDNQNDAILIAMSDLKTDEHFDLSTAETLVNMGNVLEEYYPAIAISTLIRILRDPTLAQHHTNVVIAIKFVFQSLGIKCVPYLPQVLPNLLANIRAAEMNSRDFLFQQLSLIIEVVKQHVISYMDDIFKLVLEFWTINTPLHGTLINLIEKIAIALGCEFKVYLSQLMPQMLRILSHDISKDRTVTTKLLQALQSFGANLDDYLHLIVPPIVRLFEANDLPLAVNICALETIHHLAGILDLTDYASRIIHAIVRVLDNNPDLRIHAMQTLCSLVLQLNKKYKVFIPLVQKVITKHRINCLEYEKLMPHIQSASTVAIDDESRRSLKAKKRDDGISAESSAMRKLQPDEASLRAACQASRRVSKDDWMEWLRRLSIALLHNSQSAALRSCKALAQNYPTLLRDLFNAAFVSCWTEMSDEMNEELAASLRQALEVHDLPEITQQILNLAEFMEHCDKEQLRRKTLKIDTKILGRHAMECRA